MSVQVRMYSVYVQTKGIRLFDAMAHALEFQQDAEKQGLFAWGVGKHTIEVTDAVVQDSLVVKTVKVKGGD